MHNVVKIAARVGETELVAEFCSRKNRFRLLAAFLIGCQVLAELGEVKNVYVSACTTKYTKIFSKVAVLFVVKMNFLGVLSMDNG